MADEEAGTEVAFSMVTLKVAELSRSLMRKESEAGEAMGVVAAGE